MSIPPERMFIPVEEVFAEWEKDPAYRAAYDALVEQFSLVSAILSARLNANMTQEEVAKAMGIALNAYHRLEGCNPLPSTRTLQRFAKATGTRLKIAFTPLPSSEPNASATAKRSTSRAK